MGMWMTSLSPGATSLLSVGCLCFNLMELLQDGDTLITHHLGDAAKALDDRQRLKILLALREGSLCGSEPFRAAGAFCRHDFPSHESAFAGRADLC